MRFVGIFIALFFLVGGLWAADVQIAVSGDKFSFGAQVDGALVLPKQRGEASEVLRGAVPLTSHDGSVTYSKGGKFAGLWTIEKTRPGRYEFYLAAPKDATNFSWSKKNVVEVTINGKKQTFIPPAAQGLVWHVFSIVGGDNELEVINRFLPQNRIIFGQLKDAVTGRPLVGATVNLLAPPADKVVDTTETDKTGNYVIIAPDEGMRFTLSLSAKDYIGIKEQIDYIKEDFPRRIDTSLTGLLKTAQYRFVLSWGSKPLDLDAHLTGPIPKSSDLFHISFHNMKAWGTRHSLDIDAQKGFGPETITVTRLDDGIYEYFVHDYSNQKRLISNGLAGSQATVRLYRESELIGEYTVPDSAVGTLWRVCRINGATGEVTAVDTVETAKP